MIDEPAATPTPDAPPSPLGLALGLAFAEAIEKAYQAAHAPNIHDAVHGYRKALRRAMALLALTRGVLPGRDRRRMQRILKHARRPLSPARDHAVAPAIATKVELPPSAEARMHDMLEQAALARPTDEDIRAYLTDSLAQLGALPGNVQRLLAGNAARELCDAQQLADQVARSYKRTRRAFRDCRDSAGAFHDYRRQLKQLAHQLEFAGAHCGDACTTLAAQCSAASEDAGGVVDLRMLVEFVETHRGGSSLVHEIERHLAGGMRAHRSSHKPLFALRSKSFRKQLRESLVTAEAVTSEPPASAPTEAD